VKKQQQAGLPDSKIKIDAFGYSQTTYAAYEKELAANMRHQGETDFHLKYKQDTAKQENYLSDQHTYKAKELHMFDQLQQRIEVEQMITRMVNFEKEENERERLSLDSSA